MRTVSLPQLHTWLEPLGLRDLEMRLQSLKLVILTACHKGAQALLQKEQKAPPKAAMALQARALLLCLMRGLKVKPIVKPEQRSQVQGLLLRPTMGLKVNTTLKLEQRFQAQELLLPLVMGLKINLTAKMEHRFQALELLLPLVMGLKINPTAKMEHRFQAQELLLPPVMGLKINLTAKMEQRSQVQELLLYRMLEYQAKPIVNPIVRAARHLQGQRTKRQHQHPSRHRPSNQRHKVALRKQGPPDRCRRLVANLSQAALLGRTFPS